MDTIYYTLNATRQKVSGGADLVRWTATPRGKAAPAGEVLDFARCRQSLERKAAWQALRTAAYPQEEPWEEEEPLSPTPARAVSELQRRREKVLFRLEVVTSLAILAVSLAATAAFLALV